MAFFGDARKALLDLAQGAAERAGPVASAAQQQLNRFGQEAEKRVRPGTQEALGRLHKLATGASDYVAQGYASGDERDDAEKMSHWSFISAFGEEAAKKVGVATTDFWKATMSGKILTGFDENGSSDKVDGLKFAFTAENMPELGEKLKQWISSHPKEVTKLLGCIAAGPTVVAITPAVLALIGFTPLGVAAGSIAAGIQSSLGPIAAGSAFAILMSAGAGGMGLVVVQTIAASSAIAPTCGAAAVGFMNAMKDDAEVCVKEETREDTKDGYCKRKAGESLRN